MPRNCLDAGRRIRAAPCGDLEGGVRYTGGRRAPQSWRTLDTIRADPEPFSRSDVVFEEVCGRFLRPVQLRPLIIEPGARFATSKCCRSAAREPRSRLPKSALQQRTDREQKNPDGRPCSFTTAEISGVTSIPMSSSSGRTNPRSSRFWKSVAGASFTDSRGPVQFSSNPTTSSCGAWPFPGSIVTLIRLPSPRASPSPPLRI